MGNVSSDRRLNLSFDDLDQDILDWLNSFGPRKRARVAKEAIRKAMVEGYIRPSPSRPTPMSVVRPKIPRYSQNLRDSLDNLSPAKHFTDKDIGQDSMNDVLLKLTGQEDDLDILNLAGEGVNL